MLKKLIVATVLTASLSVPALASSCPKLMKEVDAALQTAQLSDADKAKVMELRNAGEAQHKAGQHADSVNSLNEAKKILGM